MSSGDQGSEHMDGSVNGAGEPIRELRELARETSPEFLSRVRRKIHRRSSISNVASFSWELPKMILLEMMELAGHVFMATASNKEAEQ